MSNIEQRLLDCKAAAAYLGMTESALRKNVYLRRFNNALVRIGGRIYFDKTKLDRLIEDLTIRRDQSES